MKKKLIAVGGVFAVAASLVFGGVAASATEAPVEEVLAPITEVVEAPIEATEPVVEVAVPAPEPVAVPAPVEAAPVPEVPVEEPVAAETPTANEARAGPLTVVSPFTPPKAFEPYQVSVRWIIPATWDFNKTPSYQAAIFPQARGTEIPCGQWAQDDVYQIDDKGDEKILDSLGDTLTMGEDSVIYKSHVFTKGAPCAPPIDLTKAKPSVKAVCSANENDLSVQTYFSNNLKTTIVLTVAVDGKVISTKTLEAGKAAAEYVRGVQAEGGIVTFTVTAGEKSHVYTKEYSANECVSTIKTAPTVIDECGVLNDQVVYGESRNGTWKSSSKQLDEGVTEHRVVFTPDAGYRLAAEGSWDKVVDGKAVWILETTDEVCVPDKPEPVTVTSEWSGEYECGDTTVTETRTVTNVGHRYDAETNTWIVDPQPSDRSKTETRERDLTAEEIEALDCPVEVPPTEEPPAEEPPVVTDPEPLTPEEPKAEEPKVIAEVTSKKLPVTGSDVMPLAGFAGLLLLAGAALTGQRLLRRK